MEEVDFVIVVWFVFWQDIVVELIDMVIVQVKCLLLGMCGIVLNMEVKLKCSFWIVGEMIYGFYVRIKLVIGL